MMKPAELLSQCVQLRQKVVKVPGVYLIYCETSGMGYIGSSNHVYRRLSAHRAQLNGKRHGSPHLQAAWSKYGAQAFRMLLLEARAGTTEELLALENAYLMAVDRELLFNTTVPAVIGRSAGFTMSAETKAKIAAAHTGVKKPYVKRSPEAMAARKIKPAYAKLTAALAARIRADFAARDTKLGVSRLYLELGGKYGLSLSTVRRVCRGESWV
jgi:group I intron endonuclease